MGTDGDNIDIFPEGFLFERWCNISRGDDHSIQTPKGRVFRIQMWGIMPYISTSDLARVLDDLPDESQLGRNGEPVDNLKAARVCRQECTSSQIRQQLKYFEPDIEKSKLNQIRSKYRNLQTTITGEIPRNIFRQTIILVSKLVKKSMFMDHMQVLAIRP